MATLVQGYIKLLVGAGSPVVYTAIPGVTSLSGGGFTPNKIDATDFDTTPGTREYLSGPREPSAYTADMHYEQGNVQQEALFTAMASNTPLPFKASFGASSGGKQITFEAVPNLVLGAQVDGKTMYSLTIEPLASPARAALVA